MDISILNSIIEKAKEVNLHINPPTIETLKEANTFIEAFIRTNKRVLYGGTAINAFINHAEKERGIISKERDEELIDYDFYSPEFLMDSVALANELFQKGYSYVRRINALHPNTFRINIDFSKEFLADISYLPPQIFDRLPTREIDGLIYVDPQFLKLDLYNQHKNPYTDANRWEKVAKRLHKLETYYPINGGKVIKLPSQSARKLPNKLLDFIKDKKKHNLIALGLFAFSLYFPEVSKSIDIPNLEFMSPSLNDDIKSVLSAFPTPDKSTTKDKNKDKKNHVQMYYAFGDNILPKRVEIILHDFPDMKLTIYQMPRGYCLPEVFLSNKIIRTCDFYTLMRWLYTHYNLERLKDAKNQNQKSQEFWIALIQYALESEQKNNGTYTYITDCIARKGTDPALTQTFLKSFYGIPTWPSYRPGKRFLNPADLPDIHKNDFKLLGAPIQKNTLDLDFEESTLRNVILKGKKIGSDE